MSDTANLSLFTIETALSELIVAREEVTDPAEIAEIEKALAEYVVKEIKKVDNIRGFLKHCEMMAAGAKAEADLQRQRKLVWENRAERLKGVCLQVMQGIGVAKLEGRTGALKAKTNGGKRAMTIEDERIIPDAYKTTRIITEISKDAVRAALEKGQPVSGARLEERGVHVEVV